MEPIVAEVWVQLSQECVVTMVTEVNPSWSHDDWRKFCIHLRSLNFRHFGIVEATGFKQGVEVTFTGMTSTAEFHQNLPVGLKVISRAHGRNGDIISLTFLFLGKQT
jgi:hypothetical protein